MPDSIADLALQLFPSVGAQQYELCRGLALDGLRVANAGGAGISLADITISTVPETTSGRLACAAAGLRALRRRHRS